MFLLVGLGNPGSGYKGNRHNVGFMAADEIVRRHNFSSWKNRFNGEFCEGNIDGEKVLALKPQTYMNNSGQSVQAAVSFYKILLQNVIVLHDELDLPIGKVKAKTGGGAGGHNGLRSIDAHCGQEYVRIRIGIGHPGHKDLVTGFVLSDFSKTEKEILDPELEDIAYAFPDILTGGTSGFTTRLGLMNSKKGE